MIQLKLEEVIGQRIKEARGVKGYSQTELGERLGELLGTTWSRQAVSAAEHGQRAFPIIELFALASVMGISVHQLIDAPTLYSPGEKEPSWLVDMPAGGTIHWQEVFRIANPDASAVALIDRLQGAAFEAKDALSEAVEMLNEIQAKARQIDHIARGFQ